MKKASRMILRLGGGFIMLVLAGLWCGLEGLDYRPYFVAPYYAKTRERWQSQATNLHVFRGELEAGFGRALLTPTRKGLGEAAAPGNFPAVPLAGYGSRQGRPAQGVHDDLYVKAVAFRVADHVGVMVSADALIIPREVSELAAARLKQELKLSREQIYFGATHTHASLGGWGQGPVAKQFAGDYQPAVRAWFTDRLFDAVCAAVADLRPASMGQGRVAVPEFVRNRLVGALGTVDPDFSFMVVKQAEGKVALLGVYAAHATVLPASIMEFSGDYPGYWQRAVEQATGGMAVFFAGGMGSHRPEAGARGYAGAERMGQGLARIVLEQLTNTPLTHTVTLGIVGLEVTMPELHARLTDGLRLRPWLARRLLPVSDRTFLQVFRLDHACWISTPCDFSGELALGIKESCRQRGIEAVITSFNGDYVGYVIPHRYYHLEGYEPRLMSFFGPNVPDYFEELIRTMIAQLNPS